MTDAFGRLLGFCLSCFREGDIDPAGKAVFEVPDGLAVTNENKLRHREAIGYRLALLEDAGPGSRVRAFSNEGDVIGFGEFDSSLSGDSSKLAAMVGAMVDHMPDDLDDGVIEILSAG